MRSLNKSASQDYSVLKRANKFRVLKSNVLVDGVRYKISVSFLLLCEFADHAGMVLSRDQLLERVWGYDYLGDSRLVDAHIRRLRVKIEDQPDDPKHIVTIRGIGYKLQMA